MHVLLKDDERLSLRIGSAAGAVIELQILDAARPSFAVCYPALKVKRNGRGHVENARADNVLVEGVEWIVDQLARHGVVRPEFD
jgi:hypothetical protein